MISCEAFVVSISELKITSYAFEVNQPFIMIDNDLSIENGQ